MDARAFRLQILRSFRRHFCKLWAFDVSSSVSGPGYIEVSGVGEQACELFKPHLKLIGSAETQTEPETNSSKPKVNPFRMPLVPEMNRSGKAAPGFVCDGISNRFGSTNCSLRWKQIWWKHSFESVSPENAKVQHRNPFRLSTSCHGLPNIFCTTRDLNPTSFACQ